MAAEKNLIRQSNRMQVVNMAFLLERLASDCSFLQYIRELTQNAIEAIQASQMGGVIHWCRDDSGVLGKNKLCIIDTGIGMGQESMMLYLNNVSCSSSEQGLHGNFGIGGKITAVAENPYGVFYYSWTGDGEGSAIHIGRDGNYFGAKDILSDGTAEDHLVQVSDNAMPVEIKVRGRTGTKVVLGGKSEGDNTCQPIGPTGSRLAGQWISRYLNDRYFRIPAGITIKCDEFGRKNGSNVKSVLGQGWVNDQIKEASGSFLLPGTNAMAHWWILKVKDTGKKKSAEIDEFEVEGDVDEDEDESAPEESEASGSDNLRVRSPFKTYSTNYSLSSHTAYIYKNELYSRTKGPQTNSRLHKCGVLFGEDRVIIYFEPRAVSIISNTSRTQLTSNGEELDWDEYAAEFKSKMPRELAEFVDRIGSNSTSDPMSDNHKTRILEVAYLFNPTTDKVKQDNSGTARGEFDSDVGGSGLDGGSGGGHTGTGSPHGPARSGHRKNNQANIKCGNFKPRGKKGSIIRPTELPKVHWKSIKEGNRAPDDMLNRVASYEAEANMLFLNADYFVYQNWVDHFVSQYSTSDGPQTNAIRAKVEKVVRHHFEATLLEVVVTYQELAAIHDWWFDTSEVKGSKTITSEYLTMAIHPRYHLNHAMKRDIRQELGIPTRETSVSSTFGSKQAATPDTVGNAAE